MELGVQADDTGATGIQDQVYIPVQALALMQLALKSHKKRSIK